MLYEDLPMEISEVEIVYKRSVEVQIPNKVNHKVNQLRIQNPSWRYEIDLEIAGQTSKYLILLKILN